MYTNRKELLQKLEKEQNSKIIIYITGDRPGLESQIHPEVLDLLVQHLDKIGSVNKISLYLYTRGGHTLAAWSISNLISQFCDEFEVIIPSKAHSAGTLLCLGANKLIMTKQATLGPIDPSINTPLNPGVPGAPPTARVPVSVEAINGFIELAKTTGIKNSSDLANVIAILASHVHPLVLGEVYRARSQIRMLGKALLSKHMKEKKKRDKILSFLCSESGSHDYMIYRKEAEKELGLPVESPIEQSYGLIKAIYDDISAELMLTLPFNPMILIGDKPEIEYNYCRCLIESVTFGSHSFHSKGILRKKTITDQTTGIPQEMIEDDRKFEGWDYEKPNH
jgi:ClpP class serine protease